MASFKRRKYVHMATEISQYSILCRLYRGDVFFRGGDLDEIGNSEGRKLVVALFYGGDQRKIVHVQKRIVNYMVRNVFHQYIELSCRHLSFRCHVDISDENVM
jgi:hypothetical protein